MVTKKLENEVVKIFEHINKKENFVLSGGAGSGKTYSLVSVINELYSQNPQAKIACITYTNAAVHEIQERVSNNNLHIATIHDFLWDNISSFQNELKETLLEGINLEISPYKNIHVEKPYNNDFIDGISYAENLSLAKGNISHDEIIVLASHMYKKYPKLCEILNDRYDFIFVDEYQDTFSDVIEIFLEHVYGSVVKRKCIFGFFGDSMQSIYDRGIGDLQKYIDDRKVIDVPKKQNRRNPQRIINLANKLRIDDLVQEPSKDTNAPNMVNGKIKEGKAVFLYQIPADELQSKQYFEGWDFNNPKETKELRLTHNLIAYSAGFPTLIDIYDKDPIVKFKNEFIKFIKGTDIDTSKTFKDLLEKVDWKVSERARVKENRGKRQLDVFLSDTTNEELYNTVKDLPFDEVKKIYFDKDNLISDKKEADEIGSVKSKRDKLIRHLFKIQSVVDLYEKGDYYSFIRKTSFKIKSISDKTLIKQKISTLIGMKSKTIGEVIEYANDSGLCIKDDNINDFIIKNHYLYGRVSKVKYSEFINLYDYLEGYSPLSTQHKIKGEQYKNVLVILDNGNWNDYNFEYLLNPSHSKCNPNVLKRTKKLFYVCCTRAMDNLVVYCENPTQEMIENAKQLFGAENCYNT